MILTVSQLITRLESLPPGSSQKQVYFHDTEYGYTGVEDVTVDDKPNEHYRLGPLPYPDSVILLD